MTSTIKVHLVEDNKSDIDLLKDAFGRNTYVPNITVSHDGQSAITDLEATTRDKSLIPNLIILDINLPKKSGFEVLNFVKNHQQLKFVPVLVLSSSDAPADIEKSYKYYANGYLVKPLDIEQWFNLVKRIEEFWFGCAKLAH